MTRVYPAHNRTERSGQHSTTWTGQVQPSTTQQADFSTLNNSLLTYPIMYLLQDTGAIDDSPNGTGQRSSSRLNTGGCIQTNALSPPLTEPWATYLVQRANGNRFTSGCATSWSIAPILQHHSVHMLEFQIRLEHINKYRQNQIARRQHKKNSTDYSIAVWHLL